MARFRKKPVVIEAYQFRNLVGEDTRPGWLLNAVDNGTVAYHASTQTLLIQTLEGPLTAQIGDWIIQGVKGELYPCKPDIFDATYELA